MSLVNFDKCDQDSAYLLINLYMFKSNATIENHLFKIIRVNFYRIVFCLIFLK